jgi:hypothetical protein
MGQMPPFDTAFLAGLQDSNIDVSLAALRACIYFLLESDDTTRPALASRWVPDMVRALQPMLANGDRQDAVLDALSYHIELAEVFPKTYRPILAQLIPFMLEIMNNADALEKSTRQTALEMLLTLCENAPGMMKKQQGLSQALVPVLLSWMHDEEDLEDDPEWYTTEDAEDDDNESNPIVAEQALDRLARSLGGPLILPVAFSVIPSLLCSQEWQKRHGALRAISAIGEGCFKIMKAELDKVVK